MYPGPSKYKAGALTFVQLIMSFGKYNLRNASPTPQSLLAETLLASLGDEFGIAITG